MFSNGILEKPFYFCSFNKTENHIVYCLYYITFTWHFIIQVFSTHKLFFQSFNIAILKVWYEDLGSQNYVNNMKTLFAFFIFSWVYTQVYRSLYDVMCDVFISDAYWNVFLFFHLFLKNVSVLIYNMILIDI